MRACLLLAVLVPTCLAAPAGPAELALARLAAQAADRATLVPAVEALAAGAPRSLASADLTTAWSWALRADQQVAPGPRFTAVRAALAAPPPAPAGPPELVAAHAQVFGVAKLHAALARDLAAAEAYYDRLAERRAASAACIRNLEAAAWAARAGRPTGLGTPEARCPLAGEPYGDGGKAGLVCPVHSGARRLPEALAGPFSEAEQREWHAGNAAVWATTVFERRASRERCHANLALCAHVFREAAAKGTLPAGNPFERVEALAAAPPGLVPACPMDGAPYQVREGGQALEVGCPGHGWPPAGP